MCSRCGNQIRENETPIRMWPQPGDIGYDPNAKGGTEYRYCMKCCEAAGIKYATPLPDELDGHEFTDMIPTPDSCSNCGAKASDVSISEDGYCFKCVADMQDNGIHTNP
jgi:hypothetical protein